MNIKKDEFHLDKRFPFELMDLKIQPYDNMNRIHHWHECLEISFIRSGTGRYYIEDKVYDVGPGDIIIINNIEPHFLEVGKEGMHQPVLLFEPSLVWSNSSRTFDYDYLNPFFERGTDFSNKLDSSNLLANEVRDSFLEIQQEYQKRQEGYQLMIKARLLMILSCLLRYFRDSDKTDSNASNKRLHLMRLEEVMKYINENYTRDIRLDEVAAKIFVTPQYFSSFFKKVTGVNFLDYLNNLRINHAIRLLGETDRKITHIAMECGFNNTNHFNATFKKLTGKTPSLFRLK